MSNHAFAHEDPVWRERADFIIFAKVHSQTGENRWEQLWARQLNGTRFEICCIPFFVYDLALGDEVETGPEAGKRYVIKRVTKPSGRYTFRVWFTDSAVRYTLPEKIAGMGCLLEWQSKDGNLLAIDAETESMAHEVADILQNEETLGHLVFETAY